MDRIDRIECVILEECEFKEDIATVLAKLSSQRTGRRRREFTHLSGTKFSFEASSAVVGQSPEVACFNSVVLLDET